MSWETFIVGSFRFRESVSDEQKKRAIKDIEDAIECKVKWSDRWKEYQFSDVNWTSHITGDRVRQVFLKYKGILADADFSLYYLNEADENFVLSEEVSEEC